MGSVNNSGRHRTCRSALFIPTSSLPFLSSWAQAKLSPRLKEREGKREGKKEGKERKGKGEKEKEKEKKGKRKKRKRKEVVLAYASMSLKAFTRLVLCSAFGRWGLLGCCRVPGSGHTVPYVTG